MTVAEAFQAAVVSLLDDEGLNYKRSFFYWGAFISHGYGNVMLNETLLDNINARLEMHQQEMNQDGSEKATD